jgi:hypothetical protein
VRVNGEAFPAIELSIWQFCQLIEHQARVILSPAWIAVRGSVLPSPKGETMHNEPTPEPPGKKDKRFNLVYFLAILSELQKDSLQTTAVLTAGRPPRESTPSLKKT